jgi:hypothetical protein
MHKRRKEGIVTAGYIVTANSLSRPYAADPAEIAGHPEAADDFAG